MGDIIETSTYHRERRQHVYKAPHCGLKVDIKGVSGRAVIRLTKETAEYEGYYWIVIGNDCTYIRIDQGPGKVVHTPNILNNFEYRRFWISWKGGFIRLGRDGELNPIVRMRDTNAKQFNYVLFTADGDDGYVHWRFEVPPIIPNPKPIPITDGDVQWVHAENQLPDGALIGGYENGPLYIIRAEHNLSLTPGKFMSQNGKGYIPWGSEAHEKIRIEVLVGFNVTWVPKGKYFQIPLRAVVGGYAENTGEKLFIGRVNHKSHIIPGKVQPSHSVCYIPYKRREIAYEDFEILVASDTNTRHCNATYH